MSNNMYWITTFIFALTLTVILVEEKLSESKRTKGDKAFFVMVSYGIFFCLQDMFWGLCDSNIVKGDTALFVASSIFHVALVFSAYYCMKFFLSYLDEQIKYKNVLVMICRVVICEHLILVATNFFRPILFRIEDGQYITYGFRALSYGNQYFVYAICGVVTFLCAKKANKKNRDKYRSIFYVALIPLLTGIFQLYYYDAPFYSMGYFLECMFLHMLVISRDKNELSQERILDAIANSYYSMHLFDLVDNCMEDYIESEIINRLVTDRNDGQGAINEVMSASVTTDFYDDVMKFVDFSTLSERMAKSNSISMDFVGKFHGWTRAAFISIERDENGNQSKVMYVTKIIDEDKKKEQEMFANSYTDELTKLFNRRAYENDINQPEINSANKIYVSVDVNELKVTNDNLGHEAGDELLVGVAQCMKRCFGPYGKVYRVGGDEFVVILYATDVQLENIKKDFERTVAEWKGKLIDGLTVACGYVPLREFPELDIHEIAKVADERMYKAKAEFYSNKGVDRRGQAAAHTALCNLYTKILKVNLTQDTYSIVNMDFSEQTKVKGFADTISEWLTEFGKSGQVHEEDLDKYLEKTNIDYLKKYFQSGKSSLTIQYRRKSGDVFKPATMEMITADDYSADNQSLFLYVKVVEG